ncbi:MAG: type IV pilus modification PilV family protein [Minisyncoccota bacterium]
MINTNRGMTMAEVLVAASVISIFVVALVGVYNLQLKETLGGAREIKASFLAEEGLEVVKFLRNDSWDTNIATLNTGSDYFLVWQDDRWGIVTNNVYVDNLYERKVVLSEVMRDANSNIVESGGTVDEDVKKVVVSVSWKEGNATSTRALTTYITNLFNN